MKHNYIKIKEELARQIRTGEFPVGARLPSEMEMADRFGVSRETFRAAVKQLEREGLLRVKSGIGRFVIRPVQPIPSALDRLSSTSEMIRSAGLEEGECEESIRILAAEEEWADFLEIAPGSKVIVNERVRTANGEPVSYNVNIMPYAKVGEAFARSKLKGSLMQFLESECGIRLVSANAELIVPPQDDAGAAKLRVHAGTPVLLIKQTHYDEDHLPILFSNDYFRNDVFKFWVQRAR